MHESYAGMQTPADGQSPRSALADPVSENRPIRQIPFGQCIPGWHSKDERLAKAADDVFENKSRFPLFCVVESALADCPITNTQHPPPTSKPVDSRHLVEYTIPTEDSVRLLWTDCLPGGTTTALLRLYLRIIVDRFCCQGSVPPWHCRVRICAN